MEINKVHYIIHPLWQVDFFRDDTSRLVDRLIELVEREGQDEGTLFILEMNGFDHYLQEEDTSYEVKERAIEDYFRLGTKLTSELRKRCDNLFVGDPAWNARRGKTWEPELDSYFRRYIQHHQVTFSDGCEVVGHGVHATSCVLDRSETLVDAINSTYGKEARYIINEDTTLT